MNMSETLLRETLFALGGLLTGILVSIAYMFIANRLRKRRLAALERELIPVGPKVEELAEKALRALDEQLEKARRVYERTELMKSKAADTLAASNRGRA